MAWTSVFTSWAEPEEVRRDWDLLLTSSIWTEAGLLLIAVRKREVENLDYELIVKITNHKSLSHVTICCVSLLYIIVNFKSTLALGNCDEHFQTFFKLND